MPELYVRQTRYISRDRHKLPYLRQQHLLRHWAFSDRKELLLLPTNYAEPACVESNGSSRINQQGLKELDCHSAHSECPAFKEGDALLQRVLRQIALRQGIWKDQDRPHSQDSRMRILHPKKAATVPIRDKGLLRLEDVQVDARAQSWACVVRIG